MSGTAFAFFDSALTFFVCAAISLRPLLWSAEVAKMAVYHPPKVIAAHLREAGLDVTARDSVFPGVVLFDCTKLVVSVKAYAPGTAIPATDLAAPISGGAFVDSSTYDLGAAGSTMVIRTFYQWPLFVTGLGFDMANLAGSKKLLSATAAFRVEPN